jgi:hypothetical protein
MGIKYNLISGVFATLDSVLGIFKFLSKLISIAKIGFNFGDEGTINSYFLPMLQKYILFQNTNIPKYLLHVVFISLILFTNAMMLKYYVKSMAENGAAKATVYNFVISYVGSVRINIKKL